METHYSASRQFDEGRKRQGFRDQAHLDAFYRYFDHTKQCAECQKPGPVAWLSDGPQPTMNECNTAKRLYKESR